ncbi:MAG: RNA polymerase factor sigma-54 [Bacteroidales bacterium]|nr:RNA polymerase factor sigma-54 [Bacteroidales bacterium]
MAHRIGQTQTQAQAQTQQLTLTPQQLLLMGLLELSVVDLEARVQRELEENVALEERTPCDGNDDASTSDTPDISEASEDLYAGNDDMEERRETGQDELYNYATSDDVPEYLLRQVEAQRNASERIVQSSNTFYDALMEQVGEQLLSNDERQILEYLIGSLDDDGLLRKPLDIVANELTIFQNIPASEADVKRVLHVLQRFEPHGVGAQNLQECLLLQVEAPDYTHPYKALLRQVLTSATLYDDFTHKRWPQLATRLGIDDATLAHVKHGLTHLDPRPGAALSDVASEGATTIVPDFIVECEAGEPPIIALNRGEVPELRISPTFGHTLQALEATERKQLSPTERDTLLYTRGRVQAARSFIEALSQRQTTLLRVMHEIVRQQRAFFDEGDEALLHPLLQKDVAAALGIEQSTMSRIVASKYVQTNHGIFSLKHFFGQSFVDQAGNAQSRREIMTALAKIIAEEDKLHPHSDEALASLLKAAGYPVARRTVTKYREALKLPTARLRR